MKFLGNSCKFFTSAELWLLLLLFKFFLFILLMHFRFSIYKAFDPVLLSQVYIHCNIKGGNQRVWERWMKPILLLLQTWSFKIARMSDGDPGWVETRINYFAITFSWQIFGSGKKVWQQCHEDKNCGCFVYVRMSASKFERQCNWARHFCQPGKQMHSFIFWGCMTPDCPTAEGRANTWVVL